MDKKVIIPVVLIGTGIGLYFLNKAGKLDKLKALFNKKNDEIITPIVQTIQPPVKIQPPKPNPNIIVSNPFTQAELLAFQKWVNLTYKPTIPLVEDGIWGDNSAGAYNSYGTAYANKDKTIDKTKIVVPQAPLKIGDKVNAIKITKTYPGYTMVNAYEDGATDGNGNYSIGYYVGVITQITGNAIKVSRSSQPTPNAYGTFQNTPVYDFYVRATDVQKSLI